LDWRLAGGGLSATLASRGFGDPPLTVDAQVPVTFALEPFTFALPQPVPLDVDVDGVVDLARAAGWYGLEDRLVAGRLATDLSIAGSVDAPRFDGEVTLADGRYVDLATGVAIEDLRTRIAAEGRRLVVRELVANDGGDGRIRGDGAIDFAGAVPDFDVEAQMSNFAVLQRETLYVVMSGDASVDGEGGDVAVRGDFTVNQGEIFLEGGDGAAGFASLDVVEQSELDGAEDGTEAITPASVVDLDIGVAIPGRLFVRGRGLVSEWEGALQIFGTAEEPRIEGTIEYRRGYFDLFDRRFDLRRGEIQFTGASPPDPFVTVEATVELPETTAVLRVDGPALDPEVTVTSEPPMPEDEVLAQLLFDRNQSELNAFQALRLAAAVNELRGGGVGVLDRLRSGLGIDTLGVGGESADDATLEAGAYVSEDVFVQVERGLKPGSAGATVEVELTPRLNVQTRVREDSTGSVGLNWSLDY
jgi:translocation and assembly module TamB